MEHLKQETVSGAQLNIDALYQICPQCFTESKDPKTGEVRRSVDFEKLRLLLGDNVAEGDERYDFTWVGKRAALQEAAKPIRKTLRPCPEESVDWENTKNLYIEGDNLEVLKLLQNSYMGKVKMIYIDPPYNTGNDSFVYDDDFSINNDEYEIESGDVNDEGLRFRKNLSSNGRYHSDWCSMIYSRLMISRTLLSDDGVIIISIDDNEQKNLKSICNEVYGESNCLGIIANINNPKGRSDDKFIATAHEYLFVYAKDSENVLWLGFEPTDEKIIKRYNKTDKNGKKYREIDLRKTGENDLREDRPNLFYYFYYNEKTGDFYPSRDYHEIEGYTIIKPLRGDGKEGNWRWGLETAKAQIDQLIPKFMPSRKVMGIMQKDYLEGRSLVKPTTSWTFKDVNSERGTEEFVNLGFDKRLFPKPKPIGTILRSIKLSTLPKDSIVMDFFSGSATTAHAVMQLNAEDSGNRKYIMVQWPEETEKDSEAYKAGYKNICEIGKERIRRAGKKILEEQKAKQGDLFSGEQKKLDVGFRVFKCADSNMKDVYYAPAEYSQELLLGLEDNIKEDRNDLDLLFGCMLDWGVTLDLPLRSEKVDGINIHIVNEGDLVACFEKHIPESVIDHIASLLPMRVVLRDSCFDEAKEKMNFFEIFKQRTGWSEEEVRKNVRVI